VKDCARYKKVCEQCLGKEDCLVYLRYKSKRKRKK
jgi:hypothetical protein